MNPLSMLTAIALRYDVGNQWVRIAAVAPDDQDRWAWVMRLESAGFSRIQGEAGISFRLLDREWTVDTELNLGGVWQWGVAAEKGPTFEWRIGVQKDEGQWRPWSHIALQPTLLIDRYEINAAAGDYVEYDFGQSTSFELGIGVTRWSRRGWNWGIGIDYVVMPHSQLGWPGVHVTLGKGDRLR